MCVWGRGEGPPFNQHLRAAEVDLLFLLCAPQLMQHLRSGIAPIKHFKHERLLVTLVQLLRCGFRSISPPGLCIQVTDECCRGVHSKRFRRSGHGVVTASQIFFVFVDSQVVIWAGRWGCGVQHAHRQSLVYSTLTDLETYYPHADRGPGTIISVELVIQSIDCGEDRLAPWFCSGPMRS